MSGSKKRSNMTILIICLIFMIAGIAGCLFSSKIGEGELVLNWSGKTWETISISCLNAGWLGALIVYWTGRRR